MYKFYTALASFQLNQQLARCTEVKVFSTPSNYQFLKTISHAFVSLLKASMQSPFHLTVRPSFTDHFFRHKCCNLFILTSIGSIYFILFSLVVNLSGLNNKATKTVGYNNAPQIINTTAIVMAATFTAKITCFRYAFTMFSSFV